MDRQNDIWEYVQGKRTGRLANRLEREMLSDPFLYEAIEGLTTVEADHEKIVQQLQKQISKWERKRTLHIYRWVVAASFLLLAGVAVTLMYEEPLQQQEVVVAEADKSDTTVLTDSVQLMAAQVDKKDIDDAAIPSVRKISGERAEKKQLSYRQAKTVEDMVPASGETGSADIPAKSVVPAVTSKAGRPEINAGVPEPVDFRRKGLATRAVETLPKAENKKKDKRRRTDIAGVETKSVSPDSLVLEKVVRKERRTRVTHTKNRVVSERKFKQEMAIDHSEWIKKFDRYVADSLRYPEDARLEKLEGEIVLAVRLNRKGAPARIRLLQRLSPSCNREAIRLVEEYPGKWEYTEKEILLTIPFKLPFTE